MEPPHYALLAFFATMAFADESPSDEEDQHIQKYMAYSWTAVILVLLLYRVSIMMSREFRLLLSMGNGSENEGRQRFFSIPNNTLAFLKRHFINAPLFSKRHNREFRLSTAISICTLPGRPHVIFLLSLFASNIAYCAITINWHDKTTLYSDALHRTGVVIATNICALFLLAGRNNPLISLLGITFDTYNLIHRWLGRIVVLEAIAHVAFWFAGKVATMGTQKAWMAIQSAYGSSSVIISGTVAIAAFTVMLLHSPGPIRHAFYETFLHMHILMAIIATAALWVHLKGLTSQLVLLVAITFWVLERICRLFRLIWYNVKGGLTKATFEALPGEALRVSLHVARPWTFKPGQHIFLYVPSIGLWTSHPFSVAWSQDGYNTEKGLPLTTRDRSQQRQTTISLIIRRRAGFTDKLYNKTEALMGGRLTATAFVEGPYGGQSFRSYGTVMLFAAGVGITYHVPHVRDLVESYAQGICATRRVTLVWVIQSPEHLEWIRPWMTQILAMDKRRDILKILLFVSRPKSTKEIHSPSASVQMYPGKPDVAALLQKEQDYQIGAMAVSVCGTGSMADDVRKAVRAPQQNTTIDFFEEAFSW